MSFAFLVEGLFDVDCFGKEHGEQVEEKGSPRHDGRGSGETLGDGYRVH